MPTGERQLRRRGLTLRWKLTLSYAGFLVISGLMLVTIAFFLLRYVPVGNLSRVDGRFVPDRDDLLRAFAPAATGTLLLLAVIGLGGGWLLAGRMLRPLEDITDAAQRAAEGSLSHRIRLDGPRDELRDLADVFDTMLARIESHVEEQRRFAANASHELRTPLAITRTLLDVARADPDPDVPRLLTRLDDVTTRASETTEALLLLSRLDRTGIGTDTEPVDLSLAAEEALETAYGLAERMSVRIVTDLEAAPARGSRTLLVRLASNLVHNGIVHHRGPDATVWVRTGVTGEGAHLVVESTGEPLDPGLVETLTEPFQRGTRARSRPGEPPGVGLGLAIVASVVRAHAGTLELDPRTGGGLRVTVTLPAG